MVRVPIRLGVDSFVHGVISDTNIQHDAMEAFKLLMGIQKIRLCNISNKTNGEKVAEFIFKKTGMKIDIIGGKEQAALISSNLNELISKDKTYLYVDVGGAVQNLAYFPEETSFTQNPLNWNG